MDCLNIGSGKPRGMYKQAQWTNIDVHKIPGTIQMDVFQMPNHWKNKFGRIHACHCLEHINRNRRQEFLEQCYRVLMPNELCFIEVPDFEATVKNLIKGIDTKDRDLEHRMTTSVYGKQRYEGVQHCWGFTERTLSELCKVIGFAKVSIIKSGLRQHSSLSISEHYKQEDVLLAVLRK